MTEVDDSFLTDVTSKSEENSSDFHFERAGEWLHRISPRSVCELLLDLAASCLIRLPIERVVDEFSAAPIAKSCSRSAGNRMSLMPIYQLDGNEYL